MRSIDPTTSKSFTARLISELQSTGFFSEVFALVDSVLSVISLLDVFFEVLRLLAPLVFLFEVLRTYRGHVYRVCRSPPLSVMPGGSPVDEHNVNIHLKISFFLVGPAAAIETAKFGCVGTLLTSQ